MSYSYQVSYTPPAIFWVFYCLFLLLITTVVIAGQWKMFKKAGEPGWAAIVPFYNTYVLFKIAFGDGWKFLFLFIPFANFVFAIIAQVKLAKAFGKGTGFAVGLIFLPAVFIPMLGFGKAEYLGPEV